VQTKAQSLLTLRDFMPLNIAGGLEIQLWILLLPCLVRVQYWLLDGMKWI